MCYMLEDNLMIKEQNQDCGWYYIFCNWKQVKRW
jgi:hypothetical protein